MLKLILTKYDQDIEKKLIEKLKEKIEFLDADVKVGIYSIDHYWKKPEKFSCIIYISSLKNIMVKDIMDLFDIQWDYTFGPCYDVNDPSKKSKITESAVWNSDVMGGIFLIKFISWAHIYTW